jgi:hypothetical protein
MKTLPAEQGYFHSLSFGLDYKDFVQDVNAGGAVISSPISYYPFTLSYSAGHVGDNTFTEFNAGGGLALRRHGRLTERVRGAAFQCEGQFLLLPR